MSVISRVRRFSTQASSAWTLPARLYHDPAVFEQELKTIFSNSWLLFGPVAGKLDDAGSAWAQTIVQNKSLVALKTRQGQYRVFHNVCRHRAGPLVFDGETQPGASSDVLTCKYHKWCYNSEGKLLSAPHFGDPCLDKAQFNLQPVDVDMVSGLLFVRLGSPDQSHHHASSHHHYGVNDCFGDLFLKRLLDVGLERYSLLGCRQHHLHCNWKTYVENYLEGYHIAAVHPSLRASFNTQTYRAVSHRPARYVEHLAQPLEGLENATSYEGLWFWLWPNLAINVYRNGVTVEQIIPHGPRHTEIRYTDLVTPEATASEKDGMRQWSTQVTEEDIKICEAVQRGLESGHYVKGKLSPVHEDGVRYFQQLVLEHL